MPKKTASRINYKELLRNYKLLQSLMDYVPDVIYFKDRRGRLILVNKAHAKGLGLEPDKVVGKTDFDIFSKERAKLMAKDDEYVMAKGKAITDKVERSTRADGIDNYVSTTKIPRYDEKGRVVGLIGITRDITSRMQVDGLRQERDKMKKKLKAAEELNRMKSEFISVVSHELRTPLAIMKEAVSIILDGIKGEINDGQRELLVKAVENTERLKRLVEELLDVSRIEKGTLKLHYSLVNLNELIGGSAEFFAKLAGDKGITLECKLPKEEINIFVDPERINQVISNLLDNAIKFTEAGGSIEVGVNIFEDKIRIAVSDTGVGITKGDLEKIFHRFEQANASKNNRNKGVGLGLAIVKELVAKHGGEIWAESRAGIGSKFYFILPRFYSLGVLGRDLREKINSALNKSASVNLVNLLIVNYRQIDKLIRVSDTGLIEALQKIVDAALEDFTHDKKFDTASSGFQHGECNVIIPEATDKEAAGVIEMLKTRLNSYLEQNKIENVFVNIGVLDFPGSLRHPKAADIVANIHIKRIQIGAEQRQFKRYAYQVSIELVLPMGEIEKAQVLDISEGGVCFTVNKKLDTDARVKIKLGLPGKKKPLVMSGRVAWIKEEGRSYKTGLEFTGLTQKERHCLLSFIKIIAV